MWAGYVEWQGRWMERICHAQKHKHRKYGEGREQVRGWGRGRGKGVGWMGCANAVDSKLTLGGRGDHILANNGHAERRMGLVFLPHRRRRGTQDMASGDDGGPGRVGVTRRESTWQASRSRSAGEVRWKCAIGVRLLFIWVRPGPGLSRGQAEKRRVGELARWRQRTDTDRQAGLPKEPCNDECV